MLKKIGSKLLDRKNTLGLTYAEIGERSGRKGQTIRDTLVRLEEGKDVRVMNLFKICEALDVNFVELVNEISKEAMSLQTHLR